MLTLRDLWEVYDNHKDDYDIQVKEFSLGGKDFKFNSRTALLGVVNLSVDSWWNHSVCYTPEQAIRRGQVLTAQGADIVDIGAEASSSNTARANVDDQKASLLPVIKALSQAGVLTSIETYYPEVARACLEAGASVINYTGSDQKEEMYRVVADFDAGIIRCFVQGDVNARDVGDFNFEEALKDPIDYVYNFFEREIELATRLGVTKLFVDPAVGLGYTNSYYQHKFAQNRVGYQLRSLLGVFRLRKLGFPVFHSVPTPLEIFGDEVRSGQVFSSVFAILGKTDLIRTHEIPKIKAVLDTMSLV